MRRIITILTVAALMLAMLMVNALPALACGGVYEEVEGVGLCRLCDPSVDAVCVEWNSC